MYIINPYACFICPYQITNQRKKLNFFFSSKIFMESSMNNAFIISKCETSTTFSSDRTPEESSWSMYLEDFCEASSSAVHMGDFSSSSIPDAMSFVATKKTFDMSKQEGPNYSNNLNIKRTRNREIPFGTHCDLEDTASSPSRSPNVSLYLSLVSIYI